MSSSPFQLSGREEVCRGCRSSLQRLSGMLCWSDCRSRCWRGDPLSQIRATSETQLLQRLSKYSEIPPLPKLGKKRICQPQMNADHADQMFTDLPTGLLNEG